MNHILVTGATGFVGRHLLPFLLQAGHRVRAAVRRAESVQDLARPGLEVLSVGAIDGATRWDAALTEVDTVIHLAARVHVMRDTAADPATAFRQINRDGTRHLAEACAAAGVSRLVLVSSVKVMGEATNGAPWVESDPPHPCDPYATSKWEGEKSLWAVTQGSRLSGVVVRPPLVYGRGVGANFRRLAQAVHRGLPLPLASVRNRRSLVAVPNLTAFLELSARHPRAAGQTFFVRDEEDLSTPELIRLVAQAQGKRARLVPCPPALLRLGGALLGQRALVRRLVGSLQIGDAHARARLGWHPPVCTPEALRQMFSPDRE